MAQILRLPLKTTKDIVKAEFSKEMLSVNFWNSVLSVGSIGDELLPLVRQLEACLENIDFISNALSDQSQDRLRGEAQLLRTKISQAVDQLNRRLQEFPVDRSVAADGSMLRSIAGNANCITAKP